MDNNGNSALNPIFTISNANTRDTNLVSDAPSDRYVAANLDQESVIVSPTMQSMITLD